MPVEAVYVQYACMHRDCPVALAFKCWQVPHGADGTALDEEDTRCPECYSEGQQVVATG